MSLIGGTQILVGQSLVIGSVFYILHLSSEIGLWKMTSFSGCSIFAIVGIVLGFLLGVATVESGKYHKIIFRNFITFFNRNDLFYPASIIIFFTLSVCALKIYETHGLPFDFSGTECESIRNLFNDDLLHILPVIIIFISSLCLYKMANISVDDFLGSDEIIS